MFEYVHRHARKVNLLLRDEQELWEPGPHNKKGCFAVGIELLFEVMKMFLIMIVVMSM